MSIKVNVLANHSVSFLWDNQGMDVFVMTTSNTFMKNKITFDCKKWCKSNRLIGSTLCSEGCWLLLGKTDNRGISA